MNACLGNAVAEARNARIVACTAGDAELAAPMSRGRREPGSAHGHIDAAVAALEPEVGAAAADKTATDAPGGAPREMSRSTARRKSTRSASRAFGASAKTAAAALSAGTPLATRSARTDNAIVSGPRRAVRRLVSTCVEAP